MSTSIVFHPSTSTSMPPTSWSGGVMSPEGMSIPSIVIITFRGENEFITCCETSKSRENDLPSVRVTTRVSRYGVSESGAMQRRTLMRVTEKLHTCSQEETVRWQGNRGGVEWLKTRLDATPLRSALADFTLSIPLTLFIVTV